MPQALADLTTCSAMIRWISGTQDPQFVPHFSFFPISAGVAAAPNSRAHAAIGFLPTPKQEQMVGP